MNACFKAAPSGIRSFAMVGMLSGALLTASNAATIFATEGFESGLGNWNIGSRGTVSVNNDTGLYNFTGPVNSPDALTNFATTGTGAFRLENGFATLVSDVFDASAGGAGEAITINLSFTGWRTQTTRRGNIEYSNDNGASWLRVATFTGLTTSGYANAGFGTVTITEGGGLSASGSLSTSNLTTLPGGTAYSGEAFGSQSLIRFIYDTQNDNRSIFIDNLVVTTTAPIPEPTAALLGSLGALLLLRRRRL